MQPKIKICGIKTVEEVTLLDDLDVSYAGVWHGVPQGKHNLDINQLVTLSTQPTRHLKFILVTMQHDMKLIANAVEKGCIEGIQLHGFHLPSLVGKIKSTFGEALKIYKVVHVKESKCVEDDLIDRYLDSGADVIILDSYQDTQNIGSTGISIEPEFVDDFLQKRNMAEKVMLAGGMEAHSMQRMVKKHPLYGFDIDSAARENGLIDANKVRELVSFMGE
ncbi:phosphoribosylanthranilate isomerase [Alteromonas sp. a30]|uniref:phosphoribosylanthranilate isomerase n=1 Tax=Alteromonas sp. a30 TaxID=2730917 RepID=UPI00227E74B2|nr:hypothetical protein [Alteromonas sp. a30]MCY7296470.1 hypothetical protein [Alteromonas sp. a30]